MNTTRVTGDLGQIKPRGAWFTVNRACNFRCAGCYAQGTGYEIGKQMSLGLAKRLLALLNELNIRNLIVIGGEPTLWGPLLDFNKLCVQENIKTTLVTNAMRFGIDSFWEEYQSSPNTRVGISVKAFDADSLMRNAHVDSFEATKRGIERGVNLFKSGVSVVLGSDSANALTNLAKFAMDCGARHFSISPCTPAFCSGVPDGSFVMHPQDIVRTLVDAYPRLNEITRKRLSISIKTPLCIWPKEFVETLVRRNQLKTVCQLHQRAGLVFDVDGKLAICNSLYEYVVGQFGVDFHDKESLIKLVNNPRTVALYNKLTSYPSTKCVDCEKYTVCAGGCPLFWSMYDPEEIIPGL